MLIIEGPDASGKSTLVNRIKEIDSILLQKPYWPQKNQLSYYLHTPPLYAGRWLERYYLSETVYPRFKEGRSKLEDWQQFLIESALHPYAPIILYVRPSRETIKKNIRERGDYYISEGEVDRMVSLYDEAIERSTIPYITFDYEKDDMEDKIGECIDLYMHREQKAILLRSYLSSGNGIDSGRILFVGMRPSDLSMGEGYIRAFISHRGSSAFLHKSLWEAGIREMPYFTNFDKGFNDKDNLRIFKEEIEEVQPKKIIFLGRSKFNKGEWIEHPSYVKRFGKEKEWTQKIKELCL